MITVVSGLPRSGTSLMMQMLAQGGMAILTDGKRAADGNNPRGYYEYEKVRSLVKDNAWMEEAEGKAVKVIAHLLPYMAGDHEYAVIYLVRPIAEVLRSQAVMLKKKEPDGPLPDPRVLENTYARQVRRVQHWLDQRKNIKVMYMLYQEVLTDPGRAAARVGTFLERNLEVRAMAAAVDTSLWRQKSV